MEDSWQFGESGSSIEGLPGSTDWRHKEELEFIISREHSTLVQVMEDEHLLHLIEFTSDETKQPKTWKLNPITKEFSIDHGCFVTIKSIQELRKKKDGPVLVGIGGPSGSGKSSLAARVSQVLEGVVVDLENYLNCKPKDETWDVKSFDFNNLRHHLKALLAGKSIDMPIFDLTEKKRAKTVTVKPPESGVILLEGVYALCKDVRQLLDIAVAVVGGVHYDLLQKVSADVKRSGEEKSLAGVMDSVFPLFRTQIEPDLATAEIRISNKFVADSLREPLYIMKTSCIPSKEAVRKHLGIHNNEGERVDRFLDMYLKPPGDFVRTKDLIRMRQIGSRYFYAEGSQRIVDRNMIIRPRCEFEVGKTTLGGLLACNYEVAVSFKSESVVFENGSVAVSFDSVLVKTEPEVQEDHFFLVRGNDRQTVQATAEVLAPDGPWITKSYMEIVMDARGFTPIPSPPLSATGIPVGRTATPPLPASTSFPLPVTPQPIKFLRPVSPRHEPWTRSPTKGQIEPAADSWHLMGSQADLQQMEEGTGEVSREDSGGPVDDEEEAPRTWLRVELVPKSDLFNFDRGLNMAVSATQTLLQENESTVIIGIGGPSGSGKTTFARKLSNLIECQLIAMEDYYREDAVDETNYDEFSTLDDWLLVQNIRDLRDNLHARIPVFDCQRKKRVGFKDVHLSSSGGVVIVEGIYALHPLLQQLLDIRISVVGGVQSHLATRVLRDLERNGQCLGMNKVIQTVFPMFRDHIEPHLSSAHLKIVNNFDPVHSRENTVFVLKSTKEVKIDDIAKVLNPDRTRITFRKFTDSYFYLPGVDRNGPTSERDFIRVRDCGNQFAVLIREPIREGDFVVQSQVDFDVSMKTVGGLTKLGYKTAALIEVNATIHEDDQLVIEVDHLPKISRSFIQIKGSNKEAVATAGLKLQLNGTYTTMPYFEILQTTNKVAIAESVDAIRNPSAAKLQELVLRVNGKDDRTSASISPGSGGSISPSFSSAMRNAFSSLEERISRLERLQLVSTINTTVLLATSFFVIIYIVYKRS